MSRPRHCNISQHEPLALALTSCFLFEPGTTQYPFVARHSIYFLPPRHPVQLRPLQSSVLEAPLGLIFPRIQPRLVLSDAPTPVAQHFPELDQPLQISRRVADTSN